MTRALGEGARWSTLHRAEAGSGIRLTTHKAKLRGVVVEDNLVSVGDRILDQTLASQTPCRLTHMQSSRRVHL